MKQYYLVENGQQAGPFSAPQIQQKNISKDTMVWTEGLTNWVWADTFPELFPAVASFEMNFQAQPQVQPQIQHFQAQPFQPLQSFGNSYSPPYQGQNLQNNGRNSPYFGYELASRRGRFLARLLEAFIFGGFSALLYRTFGIFGSLISFVGLILVDILVFYPMFSGTVGHKVLGYKVISAKDGSDCKQIPQVAMREVLKSLLGFTVLLNMWIIFSKKKQNLYDIIADTYVVRGSADN